MARFCDACGSRADRQVPLQPVFHVDGICEVCKRCEESATDVQAANLHRVTEAREQINEAVREHLRKLREGAAR